ncbi:unnamed protein product [Heligmosomoides polygyrus]|uniref:Proline-rich protein 36-like n=1 Tax=Heligmosomoides polygyrus TaxID=6339 RepID=A0A183FHE2_HELPZ|nr:unnamed protein product [Heligmosomoides polygyrus]
MWWRLLAVVVLVVSAAQEEHFLDVKQIVKGTIEAVAKLPIPQQNTSHEEGEKNPDDFYRLFQLPADIMTKLAADAGYIDSPSTTTNGPWIVRRKVHKSSEDEQSFTQDGSEEEPRRRRKSKKNKDPTLISISDILSRVEQSSSSTPSPPAPMPAAPSPQASATNSAASLPVVQSSTDLSQSHVQPQYIYQPIVQPDGKTYYQQVLLVPGKVLSSGAVSSLRNPSIEKSSFLQERALQPKSVVQADYSITAPTFPPPIDIFRRQSQPLARAAVLAEPAQRSTLYPARFIKPAGQTLPQQEPLSRRIQITPQSDPAAISAPRPHQPM